MSQKLTHWSSLAHHWRHWGPPLRPCGEDIRTMESLAASARTDSFCPAFNVVMWGVTPEIARMRWPDGTELLAVDRSEEMIRVVWPRDIAGRREVHCADWLDFPATDGRYDLVIGDGVFSLRPFPDGYEALAAKAHRLLNAGGSFIMRFFLQTPVRETPESVIDALRALRIGSFHAFKFRLAMALQETPESGVRMGDVFDAWTDAGIDVDALVASTGWRYEEIETIAFYEDKDTRLSFPTWSEARSVIADRFCGLDEIFPSYEMGDRCPIVRFRRAGRRAT